MEYYKVVRNGYQGAEVVKVVEVHVKTFPTLWEAEEYIDSLEDEEDDD